VTCGREHNFSFRLSVFIAFSCWVFYRLILFDWVDDCWNCFAYKELLSEQQWPVVSSSGQWSVVPVVSGQWCQWSVVSSSGQWSVVSSSGHRGALPSPARFACHHRTVECRFYSFRISLLFADNLWFKCHCTSWDNYCSTGFSIVQATHLDICKNCKFTFLHIASSSMRLVIILQPLRVAKRLLPPAAC